MGIMGLLQFSLKCVELFAWPIFALAYPLFASIQAIETNSNYHMRKLVTYWIIFSLISLFELTFVKLIEWFPIWPYMKIIAICWLVIPSFGHAYNAYKSIVHMCSDANMQALVNWLTKQDKVNFLKTEETFLSVAEKFIKENGTEALEELISNKSKGTKTGVTITEKREMATRTESKGAKPDVEEIQVVANRNRKGSASVEVKQSNAKLAETERKIVEAVEIKEMNDMPTAAVGAAPSLDKVQRHWSCAVCQVTTMSQTTLNSHLQGKKHIAKCEELKAKKQTPKNKNSSSSSTTSKSGQANQNANKCSDGDRVNQSNSKQQEKKVQVKKGNMEKKYWCSICNVKCPGKIDMASHLKGKKHLSMVQELVTSFS